MQKYIYILLSTVLFCSCTNDGFKTKKFDLIQYGIPLTIKAPQNAVISQPMENTEVWVIDSTSNFQIQIRKAGSLTNNMEKVKTEELNLVKASSGFSKIIQEDDNGFIFEENYGKSFYDFRYFVIQGDNKYIFQKVFTAEPTLEEIQQTYKIVRE